MNIDTPRLIKEIRTEIENGANGLVLQALLEKLYNAGVTDGITKTRLETLPKLEQTPIDKAPTLYHPYDNKPYIEPWTGDKLGWEADWTYRPNQIVYCTNTPDQITSVSGDSIRWE
jgi:hypothetical protein